ncbi:GNAT family N-acetyltransferase [Aliirhizobium terrae]|uniref:GNAT family N-acetyltransferase n=1 Tax=Terrirhizobium terrae TaxID=2926709 RepID=UPI002576AFE9|nr:GNAT family N-acetyltransferase [Rhizobium sp. CC-CFT758]WJH40469.1 GNAT family N-acetyltransferase [Rhizobium sp. CC-CFT758]
MQVDTVARISPATIEAIEKEAWLDLYAAAPAHVRGEMALASTEISSAPAIACRGMAVTELNRSFGLEDAEAPDLASLTTWLEENADPAFALQIANDESTAAIQRWAGSMGLTPTGNGWSKLVRRFDFSSEIHAGGSLQSGIEIVTDPEPAVYGRLVVKAFGFPEILADWFGALVGRPNWTTVVALLDGKPAGSGALFVKDNWAWFGVGGTLPEARRNGVQGALIDARTKIALAKGATHITAETGRPEQPDMKQTSRDNFLRRGFVEAYHRLNFKRPA